MEFTGENLLQSLSNELKRIKPSEIIVPETLVDSDRLFAKIKGAYYTQLFR